MRVVVILPTSKNWRITFWLGDLRLGPQTLRVPMSSFVKSDTDNYQGNCEDSVGLCTERVQQCPIDWGGLGRCCSLIHSPRPPILVKWVPEIFRGVMNSRISAKPPMILSFGDIPWNAINYDCKQALPSNSHFPVKWISFPCIFQQDLKGAEVVPSLSIGELMVWGRKDLGIRMDQNPHSPGRLVMQLWG